LTRRNNSWNASLISLATATTAASVGLLVDRKMYGRNGDAIMLVVAILSLVASLVVSSANYGARARSMEASYKKIQEVAATAENLRNEPGPVDYKRYLELHREYQIAIESSENHTSADYHRYKATSWRWSVRYLWRDTLLGLAPYISLVVPVVLLVPFLRWFQ
jgi:SMODS and SLOG-associating 2TM effector domain family 5